MTGKLKRKLNDLGVDTASRAATESFCLIGTPLPPLEKSKDNGEFVPLWKQEVRDEKGRRRLHGAFTGGFSAGYFNTVGSKDGWTPSTFVSSRSDRAKQKAAKPEDFMDEEDLAEIRDNQKLVSSTDEMDVDFWSRDGKPSGTSEQDSIMSALEAALLPAPKDSVGARILKKMGWRFGHGIGPKVTYEQRKRQAALASDAAGRVPGLPSVEDHEEAKKHLYPPIDTKVPSFVRKDNRHGLGYTSGLGLTDLVNGGMEGSGKVGQNSKGPNISAGFGLGALNEADEDDLDVYDGGMDKGHQRVAYEDDNDEGRVSKQLHDKTDARRVLRPSHSVNRPTDRQTTFSDGTPCISGFVVSSKKVTEDVWFAPPKLPQGWTPNPRRVWEQDSENIDRADKTKAPQDSWHRNSLTHADRGDLLGEAPQAPRSGLDFLSPRDRERLQKIAANRGQRQDKPPEEPSPSPAGAAEAKIPRLDAQIAKMALQGFQPFTTDPVKQARYTAFLQAQAEAADSIPFGRMPNQGVDAFQRELEDYVRSAQIFKPVSGAMAGRFARASVLETGPKAQEGLHRPAESSSYLSVPDTAAEEKPKEESPKENAARLGMFGALTREVTPWRPARLLCKRFGVKEPEIELETEKAGASASSASTNQQSTNTLAITDGVDSALTGSTKIGAEDDASGSLANSGVHWSGRDIENIGLGENEQQGKEILSYERPAMDIFKAIFASDDEDDGEGKGAEDDNEDGDEDLPKDESPKPTEETSPENPPEAAPSTKVATDYANAAGKVDMTSFKPTFVPRSERSKKDEKKDKKKDKAKKKKGKTILMSFDLEEDGGDGRDKSRDYKEVSHKKKRKEKNGHTAEEEDDDSMWIEKPAPDIVQSLPTSTTQHINQTEDTEAEVGPQRGRKRAIDFL